jgi:phosphoenolpyruvate carboxykinase (ATP)
MEQLKSLGLTPQKQVYLNLSPQDLTQHALDKKEGELASNGALVVKTGKYTGRTPKDKFVVRDETTENTVWWGSVNQPINPETFDKLYAKVCEHLNNRDLYVFNGFAGADPAYRLPLRVVAQKAWHTLFAHTLFIRPSDEEIKAHIPEFTVLNACELLAKEDIDALNSETFVLVNLTKKVIIIGGTEYAGEMKKGIFSVMNFYKPQQGVLTMHCSSNVGQNGDSALFFGLSGTGKTTLSADPERKLIGDDEHGWSDTGIFNIEGGCYAKCIKLSQEAEPQIWSAIRKGSVLENVVIDPTTKIPDYDDGSITENTRVTYPVEHIDNCILEGTGPHPKNIIFLTCDAFGVLPPIAKLTQDQAMYHFLSGYTAKVAGTEAGITEPQATFSACFGAPFMPLHPTVYAELLGKKMAKHKVNCWLVNTGWSGGPYGEGNRMKIQLTRTLLNAALSGQLDKVNFTADTRFNFLIPDECKGVPTEVLTPKNTWKDKDAYEKKASHLAKLFNENFKDYESKASEAIKKAAPK